MVRTDRFPNMKALVDAGHARGLKVGTYLNNCICNEHGPTHYAQDVDWMVKQMDFDGVKIDSCGSSQNVSLWAELLNQTGKAIRIENCHNSWPDFETGSCPMNFFRTGGDISPNIGSILEEAYATVNAADLPEPRSRPGCWAYPDMSEVGNFQAGPHQDDQEKTHWALWCIISSPLVLGFDMNDTAKMDRIWGIITNTDALSISAAWAGHPGTLIKAYPAQTSQTSKMQVVLDKCDGGPGSTEWRLNQGRLEAPTIPGTMPELCMRSETMPCPPPTTYFGGARCGLALGNCSELPPGSHWNLVQSTLQWWDGHQTTTKPHCLYASPENFNTSAGYFTRKAATVGLMDCPVHSEKEVAEGSTNVRDWESLVQATRLGKVNHGQPSAPALNFTWTPRGELQTAFGCLRVVPLSGVQLWAKPLRPLAVAVLLINPTDQPQTLSWPLRDVPRRFTGAGQAQMDFQCTPGRCWVRDVWRKTSFAVTSEMLPITLQAWASVFYILSSDGEANQHLRIVAV